MVSSKGSAEHVYDYRSTAPEDMDKFDVVVDAVGTDLHRYRRLLAPGGRMVALRFDTNRIVRSLLGIGGSAIGRRRTRFFRGAPDPDLLAELARYADDGTVRPVVDNVYPFLQVADAHRHLEGGGVSGKIVITITARSGST